MAEYRRGLGRGFKSKGLEALIDTGNRGSDNNEGENSVIEIDIMKIEPNKKQPRKKFERENLEELADSIREIGIIQPLIVTKDGEFYKIVAGERRYRAARIAGVDKIPVIVRKYDELEALQAALIENIQREDLDPIDEAMTYKRFNEEFSLSQEEIAKKVGKNRSTVANSMRLLKLDERVLELLKNKKLSVGHCKVILGVENGDLQYDCAQRILDEDMSVRKAEEMVKIMSDNEEDHIKSIERDKRITQNIYAYAENELRVILGANVKIRQAGKKRRVQIDFSSDEEVDGFLSLMKSSVS